MVTVFRTIISFFISVITVFSMTGFFGNTGNNAYDVKNADDVLLDFAVISDVHMTDEYLRRMVLESGLDDMTNAVNKPDALVIAGDMTDDGIESDYENLSKAFSGYDPAENILLALGNHDTWTDENDRYEPVKENFLKYSKEIADRDLTECYYSTEINGYTFIVMASEGTHVSAYISPAQLEWLKAEMDKAAEKGLPVFVISHWPVAFTHGLPESFGEEEPEPMDGSFGDQNAEVEAILKDYENVFLISGHIHNGLVNEERSELYGYTSVESYGSLHSINLPSFMFPTSRGNFMNGSGYSIEVYENEVVIRARNFISGTWLPDYDVTIPLV
ncbi:MAG: metallophosphoesterase [Clostridia bacterium]|nr:metallophosphoesterase [Clostridia bacterium]